jgi:DEAD/DEAH box helicase domain-containing protein
VVHCYSDGTAFEVEFVTPEGKTVALLTLTSQEIRGVNDREYRVSAEFVTTLAEQAGLEVVESLELPGRQPRYLPVPGCLDRRLARHLAQEYPNGLYSQQADAIEAAVDGEDLTLATSTASGKSLVFMTVGLHFLLKNPSAVVLALYPSRALIHDQMEKWVQSMEPFGLSPGQIDGGVPVSERLPILGNHRVILMTPDVAHAWLMSNLEQQQVASFLSRLELIVLDEAHVYDGVFGTNMAYLLRRMQAIAGPHRVICSTATLGEPDNFVQQLVGRRTRCFGSAEDGSATPPKTVLLATGGRFEDSVKLLASIAQAGTAKFLAFADSRRGVELIVAAARRFDSDTEHEPAEGDESSGQEDPHDSLPGMRILPYRAGYEEVDRKSIQRSLAHGTLSGVVSTSALELGLDIGDIDLIVMLSTPPSVKTFFQRLGRGGRRNPGVCLLLDTQESIMAQGLNNYVARPPEPNWLYLENRYIQYANALCATSELRKAGGDIGGNSPLRSLPASFMNMLQNELTPSEAVPSDLFVLKQRGESNPHHEFPLRSGIEKNFRVKHKEGWQEDGLGSLSFSQVLREGYPGAVYYYMSRPYRVQRFNYRDGEIHVRRERHFLTEPLSQTMVFPKFQGGTLGLWKAAGGFLAEADMQVSERVLGFNERRGPNVIRNEYAPGSPYYQRPLNRFFETTGVCWCFDDPALTSERIALRILEAFCLEFGVLKRDLGFGRFSSNRSPDGAEPCGGICIYDGSQGSLRLTAALAQHFDRVVNVAISLAQTREDQEPVALIELGNLAQVAKSFQPVWSLVPGTLQGTEQGDWVEVIAPGEKAMYTTILGVQEVDVITYRYTPRGIVYELRHPTSQWTVPASGVNPIHSQTRMLRVNLMTGEEQPIA